MFYNTKAYKHLNDQLCELRQQYYDLKKDHEYTKQELQCLTTELEVLKATVDRKAHYIQDRHLCMLSSPFRKTHEDLQKDGYVIAAILDNPKWNVWVKE